MFRLRFAKNNHVDDPNGHAPAHRNTFADWICSNTNADDVGCRADRLGYMIDNARSNRSYHDTAMQQHNNLEKRRHHVRPPDKSVRHQFPFNPIQEQFGISSPSAEEEFVRQREAMEIRKAHAKQVIENRKLREREIEKYRAMIQARADQVKKREKIYDEERDDEFNERIKVYMNHRYRNSITMIPNKGCRDHAYEIARLRFMMEYPACVIDDEIECKLDQCAEVMVKETIEFIKSMDAKNMKDYELHDQLVERGCVYEKREDQYGRKRSGYWMDGVYLGRNPRDAKEALDG